MARILVIDDNDLMREMLREMLEACDHEVTEAPEGKTGVALFRKAPADLIITDIMMPEEDGLEVIQELRRDYPEVKIIAISAGDTKGRMDYLEFAGEFGAFRTFRKPFDPNALVSAVSELLGEG